MRCMLWLC